MCLPIDKRIPRFKYKDANLKLSDFEKFANKVGVEVIKETNNSNAAIEKSLAPRERETLLKIIGGLAMDGYGMDIHAKRLSGVSDLLDDLAKKGVTIDQDTLSKHLKAAAVLIPKPKSN